jgi:pre-rRNA-processing protein TSR4
MNLWDAVMLGSDKPSDIVKEVAELSIKDAAFCDKAYPVGFPPTRLHICEEMIYEKETKKRVAEVEESIPAAYAVNDGEEWVGEAYESSHPMGVDKAFLAFQKRIASYPRQCVRFSPAGRPLLFHQETLSSQPGSCSTCGQARVFELQLMPAILSLLPCNDEKHLGHLKPEQRGQHPIFGDAMEWGTVMVFSCGTCSRPTRPTLIRASTHTQIETV